MKLQDELLSQRVWSALHENNLLSHCSIRVDAQGGQVYLTGKVENAEQRQEAEEIASRLYGVETVINNLDYYLE